MSEFKELRLRYTKKEFERMERKKNSQGMTWEAFVRYAIYALK